MSNSTIQNGDKFYYFTVVEQIGTSAKYLCRCDCGTEKVVYRSSLLLGKDKSCGCWRASKTPNIGDVVDSWTIIGRDKRMATCRCVCGVVKDVEIYTLGKSSKSCGHERGRHQILEPENSKTCFSCLEILPLDRFHREDKGRKGRRPYCKECVRAHDRSRNNTQRGSYRTIRDRLNRGGGRWVGDVTIASLSALIDQFSNRCWICEEEFDESNPLSWDHYQPLAKGGDHSVANLRPTCGPCNRRKHAKWPITEEILESIRSRRH